MSQGRDIRIFAYVDYPYDRVRRVLTTDALAAVHGASEAASFRTKSIASGLGVALPGIGVKKEIPIAVREIKEKPEGDSAIEGTRFHVEWKATESPGLFPLATAELSIHPLTDEETQLDVYGQSQPAADWLGSEVEAVVSHRIAEASVHRFVSEVAKYLKGQLAHDSPG
ncbi:MAG: hypothetical protein ACRD21_00015 [Vicinamibacteria bacterium]